MIKFRHVLYFSCIALLLTGCSVENMGVLDPKGTIAADQRLLLFTAIGLMLFVVIPVILMNFYFAWKYRASNTKAKYSPDFAHSTLLEIIWWGVPIIIIAILGTITWITSHRYDPYRPLDNVGAKKPLVIQVIAMNWKWLFIYPQQNIASVNFVQMPVNTPVRFFITADAPMNSFQIPQLAGQIYAMPGMQTELNVMATENGDYPGISANYSGVGFAGMTFTARVSSQADFDAWVKKTQQSQQKLSKAVYAQLAKPSENNPVAFYAPVSNNLFNNVIMSYMMPMPSNTSSANANMSNMDMPGMKMPQKVNP
ncbi:MAG: ubiquinol oxidase subunit II [Gammaproteobacteria bacterium]|nr:ubiquinol oxidase subunit II [Gammaproteobacteria bacterium]